MTGVAGNGLGVDLLQNFEVLQRLFVNRYAEPRHGIIQFNTSVHRFRLAFQDVPKELVANLDIHHGKEFRHRAIVGSHHYLKVVMASYNCPMAEFFPMVDVEIRSEEHTSE